MWTIARANPRKSRRSSKSPAAAPDRGTILQFLRSRMDEIQNVRAETKRSSRPSGPRARAWTEKSARSAERDLPLPLKRKSGWTTRPWNAT